MFREEKGTKRIDLERGECFGLIDVGGRPFGVKDARDAKCEAEVAG